MYNSEVTNLTENILYNKISQLDILKYYTGKNIIVNKTKIHSPLRVDNNPSLAFFSSKKGDILYKDLATGDSGDCIKFVMKKLRLSTRKATILHIYNELKLGILQSGLIHYNQKLSYTSNKTTIKIKRKLFNKRELNYWNSYYIDLDLLNYYNVNAVSHVWVNDNLVLTSNLNNPIFSYKIYNNFKIYLPYEKNKSKKWLNNCNSLDIQGLKQLPLTGELLIITKSLKDVMVLKKLGYNSIAPHGESHKFPELIISNLIKRFKNIIIFYDNDYTGIYNAKKLNKLYGWKYINIHEKSIKDISDYIKLYGINNTNNFLSNSIKI